ncbi:MAG: hypothetical protein KKG59_04250 [Nanoarchaeota archaeon]|nr:hypothetical protein [Nanoarchaeota archaeon]
MERKKTKDERRQKKVQIFMAVFVVLLMVMSSFQLFVGNQDDQVGYSNYNFQLDSTSRMYLLELDGKIYSFYSFPDQIDHLNVSPDVATVLQKSQAVVVTMNPEAGNLQNVEQTRYEISKYIPGSTFAVTKNVSDYEDFPIYTCNDAREFVPVIFLNVSDNFSIDFKGYCVILNANNSDIMILRDRLLYSYLGVIKDGE